MWWWTGKLADLVVQAFRAGVGHERLGGSFSHGVQGEVWGRWGGRPNSDEVGLESSLLVEGPRKSMSGEAMREG